MILPPKILLLSASPHTEGSTAKLADLIENKLQGQSYRRINLVQHLPISGCIHCGACETFPHTCPLATQDTCEELFSALQESQIVLWLSPVYFYGLPAQAKALVDRAQRFWHTPLPLTGKAFAFFIASRMQGEKLFDASRLALKYFFASLGLNLEKTLGFRGVTTANDFTEEQERELSSFLHSLKQASTSRE